jgi:hypothetical protein
VETLRSHLRSICLASLLDVLGFFLLVEIRKSPDQGEGENVSSKELRGSVLNLRFVKNLLLSIFQFIWTRRVSSSQGGEEQRLNFDLLTNQVHFSLFFLLPFIFRRSSNILSPVITGD